MKTKKGFELIEELLVVIAIVSILAAILLPAIGAARRQRINAEKAKQQTAEKEQVKSVDIPMGMKLVSFSMDPKTKVTHLLTRPTILSDHTSTYNYVVGWEEDGKTNTATYVIIEH